jgi:spore germination protein YaaH
VTPAVALALAEEHGAVATWDDEAEEARFDYAETRTGADASGATTTCTVTRTVWFLDDRAIHRRAWIAHRENLHGVAIWALGNDDPSLWTALRSARGGEQEWTSPTLPPRTSADTPPAS